MHLDLSDDETAELTKELDDITRNDRYPFSERIRTLKAILAPHQQQEARKRLEAGHMQCSVGRSYNVSQSTISQLG